MTGFECFPAILTDMGHGSEAVGHASQFRWVTGSWVTLPDPLPALYNELAHTASINFLWGEFSRGGGTSLTPLVASVP